MRLNGGKGRATPSSKATGSEPMRSGTRGTRVSGQPSAVSSEWTALDPARTKLELGEMVRVELEIQNLSPTEQENLALVDRLPAGFEIEAASSIRGFRQRGQRQWNIAHRNTRDDRIELFGRLNRGRRRRLTTTCAPSARAIQAAARRSRGDVQPGTAQPEARHAGHHRRSVATRRRLASVRTGLVPGVGVLDAQEQDQRAVEGPEHDDDQRREGAIDR